MPNVLGAEGIVKTFDLGEIKVRALRGIDLAIEQGDLVAVMGHSGSGKSTFMNILGCLDLPTEGRLLIDGKDVAQYDRDQLAAIRNQKIGFVFQAYNLLPRTTALENVKLPLIYNSGVSSRARLERSEAALRQVDLGDRLHHYTNQLSGGQQQRVAIARALVNEPLVILADEPTGNLDTRTSYGIMQLFQALNARGKTILIVTHESDIAMMCNRNIIFKDGRVVKDIRIEHPVSAASELANMPPEEDYT